MVCAKFFFNREDDNSFSRNIRRNEEKKGIITKAVIVIFCPKITIMIVPP